MSVTFYSDDSEPINKRIPLSREQQDISVVQNVDDHYEIDKCVKWIQKNNFSKVTFILFLFMYLFLLLLNLINQLGNFYLI